MKERDHSTGLSGLISVPLALTLCISSTLGMAIHPRRTRELDEKRSGLYAEDLRHDGWDPVRDVAEFKGLAMAWSTYPGNVSHSDQAEPLPCWCGMTPFTAVAPRVRLLRTY